MRHFVIVGVLSVVFGFVTYFGLTALGLMPVEASAQSLPVDWMWNMDMIAMSFLLAIVIVPLAYALIVFRRRKGESGDGEHITDNHKLEITWTVIPLVIVLIYAYLGSYTLGETEVQDPNAKVINVTAHQWDWAFTYPEGFTSNELHLVVNKQVDLKMQSLDVIHSFWVPEFRIKQDVIPGRVEDYRITPIRLGNYKVRCAELCGAGHSYMIRPVIVSSQADYDAWAKQQKAAAAALQAKGGPEAGKALVAQNGCTSCHSINGGKLIGPTWQGLFGSKVKLSDGTTVTADEAYLIKSIEDPSAQVVQGYPDGLMPSFGLTNDQVKNIVSYIETLK